MSESKKANEMKWKAATKWIKANKTESKVKQKAANERERESEQWVNKLNETENKVHFNGILVARNRLFLLAMLLFVIWLLHYITTEKWVCARARLCLCVRRYVNLVETGDVSWWFYLKRWSVVHGYNDNDDSSSTHTSMCKSKSGEYEHFEL